jgi:hypothetical protein
MKITKSYLRNLIQETLAESGPESPSPRALVGQLDAMSSKVFHALSNAGIDPEELEMAQSSMGAAIDELWDLV